MIVLEQLKLLVNLSRIDGDMATKEKDFIISIGKAHGFPESSVETLFYATHELIIPNELSADQKFNYLFTLVQLMKLDERLYSEEMKFCAGISTKLGYKPEVMVELLLKVKSGTMDKEETDALKELTARFFINQ